MKKGKRTGWTVLLFLMALWWPAQSENMPVSASAEQNRGVMAGQAAQEMTIPGGSVSGNETGGTEETPSVSANRAPYVSVSLQCFDEMTDSYVEADAPYIGSQPYRIVLRDMEPGSMVPEAVRLRSRVRTAGEEPEETESVWSFLFPADSDVLSSDGRDMRPDMAAGPVMQNPAAGEIFFMLEGEEGRHIQYQELTLELTERNGAVYDLSAALPVRTVEIDRKAPQVRVSWNGTGKPDYFYHGGIRGFFFTVEASDEEEMTAAVYCADSVEQAQRTAEKKENVPVSGDRACFGRWVYNREDTGSYPDQVRCYVVRVTDRCGNTTWSEATEVRIDETAPELAQDRGKPAVYYQFENMSGQKRKVPVSDGGIQGCDLEPYLLNDRLLSRSGVTVTVDVRDVRMAAAGPNESGVASGVTKAVLKTDRQTFLPEKEDGMAGAAGRYTFRIPAETGTEQEYRLERLELTDRAGNVTTCLFSSSVPGESAWKAGRYLGELTVAVDAKEPEVSFCSETYTVKNQDGRPEWYSAAANGNHPFYLTANTEDRYGIYSVEWYMFCADGHSDDMENGRWQALTASNPGMAENVPESRTNNPAQNLVVSRLSFLKAQNRLYAVRVTDWAGNRTDLICQEDVSENRGSQVNVDNQAPEIKITGQMLHIFYQFKNINHEVETEMIMEQMLEEKGYLADGKLVSGRDVSVSVEAADHYEKEQERASGIKEVTLITDRGERTVSAVNAPDGMYRFLLTGAVGEETVYECRGVRVTDYAGNSRVYSYGESSGDGLTVVVDKKGPAQTENGVFFTDGRETEIRAAGENGSDSWYSAAVSGPKTIHASVCDDYGVYAISWFAVKGERVYPDRIQHREQIRTLVNPDEKGGIFTHSMSFSRDQDQLYAVAAVDRAGNETVFWKDDSGAGGSRVRIDNMAPEPAVRICWESDADSSAKMEEDQYEMPETGFVYGRDRVALQICVRDRVVPGLYQGENTGISSDIRNVDVTVSQDGRKKTVTAYHTPQTETAKIGRKTYLEFEFPIVWENESGTETEKTVESIAIRDCAGNVTIINKPGTGEGTTYILDHKPPVLEVDYHEDACVRHVRYPDTCFYKRDPAVTVSVTERYFYPEDGKQMQIDDRASGAMNRLVQSEWKQEGQTHSSIFSAPGDGRYCFSVRYTDRSGNRLTGEGVEDGKYVSQYLVVDTTRPVIEVTYTCAGADITEEIGAGNVYADTVVATVRITEVNFDPALAELRAVGRHAADNVGFAVDWDGEWKQESTDVYVNTVTFAGQGTYQFQCGVKDMVGWEADPPQSAAFSVDTTAPEAEIIWQSGPPENSIYYAGRRTAYVRVRDRFFTEEKAEILLEESAPQPVMEAWNHIPAAGCTGETDGHVDHCIHETQLTFEVDGVYNLSFRCRDRAGYDSGTVAADPFTIDRTCPELTVTYDNSDVRNGFYYRQARTAVITVTEHNFREEDVTVNVTAKTADVGEPVSVPFVGPWSSSGDIHKAFVTFAADGTYTLEASCKDPAGNTAQPYERSHFVIDTTPPVLEITGVQNHSANQGTVAPCIRYLDEHPDRNSIMRELTGAIHDGVVVDTVVTAVPGGQRIQYDDFPRKKETDDLYTLHVTAADLAGNRSECTVIFSVNRFGSVYVPDYDTEVLLQRVYTREPVRLRVTEINVDLLREKEITYSRDGEIMLLEQGADYTVTVSGDETGWKAYTYDIGPENFQQEGTYTVTLYSEDRASNQSTNRAKEMDLSFIVDTTAPSIVVAGVENQMRYYENRRRVNMDIRDNIALSGASVYLNNHLTEQYDAEQIAAAGGVLPLELSVSDRWQTLYVTAVDAAGNECTSDPVTVLISGHLSSRRIWNRWWFPGSMAAVIVLTGAGILVWVRKKCGGPA